MEYQKIINLLYNTLNQPSNFRTKKSVEINDDSRGTNNTKSQIKFNVAMLKRNLCEYSDVCILIKRTITLIRWGADRAEIQTN